jgi:hypothetical protein
MIEDDASAVVSAAAGLRREDLLYIREPIVLEASAHDGRGRFRAVADRLGKAEVQKAVRLEIRMRKHVEESALPLSQDRGNTFYRVVQEVTVTHDAESAGPLRDQHVTVRQEGHGPRSHEPIRHRDELEVMKGGPVNRRLAVNRGYGG